MLLKLPVSNFQHPRRIHPPYSHLPNFKIEVVHGSVSFWPVAHMTSESTYNTRTPTPLLASSLLDLYMSGQANYHPGSLNMRRFSRVIKPQLAPAVLWKAAAKETQGVEINSG